VAWWPHMPACMSRRSSRHWGMGTHRWRMPEAARLYSSPLTRVKDLAILAMRLASDWFGGFPSSHPGDVFVTSVLFAGNRLNVHGFGLVGSIPLEERSRGPRPWALRPLDSREPPRVPRSSKGAA
jgi:hypothetical protein